MTGKKTRLERGMPPAIVDLLVELGASIHSGLLRSDYEKHKPALGKVKLQEFIQEFVAVYNKNSDICDTSSFTKLIPF